MAPQRSVPLPADAVVKPPMTRTEEDIGAELAALRAAVSKMTSSLVWRTGQEIVVPVPQIKEVPVMKQETFEGMGEMPEIVVVSDAVKGISPREPVQQRTPEQIEAVPQFRQETADVVELVLRERVQQRSAEKEILEIFENFPQERISERTQIVDVPVPQILGELVAPTLHRQEETVEVIELSPPERMWRQSLLMKILLPMKSFSGPLGAGAPCRPGVASSHEVDSLSARCGWSGRHRVACLDIASLSIHNTPHHGETKRAPYKKQRGN